MKKFLLTFFSVLASLVFASSSYASDGCSGSAGKHALRVWANAAPYTSYPVHCKITTCKKYGWLAASLTAGGSGSPGDIMGAPFTLSWGYQIQSTAVPAGSPNCPANVSAGPWQAPAAP